jgi:hypothetical protein
LIELPPLKILSQILILQAIWYGVATALILFTALVAGRHFTLDMVLSWRSLRGDTTVGWMLGLVWMLNSFIGYFSLSSIYLPLREKLTKRKQSNSPPLLHLALKTRPRFCPNTTFHPPPNNIVLLTLHTPELAVVGVTSSVRGDDDELGGVDVSVERAAAD